MVKYLLRRLLIFIPTLLVVSFLAFALSKLAPGDPVEIFNPSFQEDSFFNSPTEKEQAYRDAAHLLGLDRPSFYFSIRSFAYPDTLDQVVPPLKRKALVGLLNKSGNWNAVRNYYQKIQEFDQVLNNLPDTLVTTNTKSLSNALNDLYLNANLNAIQNKLNAIQLILDKNVKLIPYTAYAFTEIRRAQLQLSNESTLWKLFIPTFRWHGLDNQYHTWLFNFIKGDFGRSYTDGRPVSQKIAKPLKWTLIMNVLALLISYGISIPLGLYIALRKGQFVDRLVTVLLFMFYSLPSFWVGTLLIIFFTNPEYGMDWFPTLGLSALPDDAPASSRFWDTTHHLILPVFCLTYGSLAFITRQMRNSSDVELNKLYALSAKARGFSNNYIAWRHILKNAIFPIITLFAAVIPALFAGSFVVEFIFNIPGMGLLTISAIQNSDWPVVYTVMMLSSVVTIIGILIADLLYVLINPRVSY